MANPHFIIDVEADGPAPGLFSMVSFAAVELRKDGPGDAFYGEVAPISEQFNPGALASCHMTRERHLLQQAPAVTMAAFDAWVRQRMGDASRAVFLSDNPAFDWQFINYYLHRFVGANVFGHSARRIGDLAAGLERKFTATSIWKRLRKTKHTHHPVDDAMGNAEALYALAAAHSLALPFPEHPPGCLDLHSKRTP